MSRRLSYPQTERGWTTYERKGTGWYPPQGQDDLAKRIAKTAQSIAHYDRLSNDMSYAKWERDAWRKLYLEEVQSLAALSSLMPRLKRIILTPSRSEIERVKSARIEKNAQHDAILTKKLAARRKLAQKGWWAGGYASPANQWRRRNEARQRKKLLRNV